ncbi:hypothetical protein B0T14DRAFT_428336 [Immersiella caudata]|uniref:NAD(P)-binding protein n=1 Tax=Immersiella caudata TaxID=314043 RepID=A0AA39WXM6_9PEZI|nr:hypothetical protein B0T14DRAFT_428336 [Immersiella caudata]
MLYASPLDSAYHPSGSTTVDPIGYGKVAVVTGCTSSIGLAVTQLLLAHQFSICGLDNVEFDYRLLREADHGRFHFHKEDLSARDGEGIQEGVRICRSVFGERIDALINIPFLLLSATSPNSDALVLSTKLTAPILMMQAVLPLMKPHRSGAIVNVACPAAVDDVAHTAAREGLLGATKSVAWGCRGEGVRVNAVLPGVVTGVDEKIAAMEVARAVLFLASEEARGVNGVGLPVGRIREAV